MGDVRNTLLAFVGFVFLALVIGGYLVATDQGLPVATQVENEQARPDRLGDKAGPLALVVIGSVGLVGGMGVGLAVLFWRLNSEVKAVETQEPRPFSFSLKAEGNSVGTLIQENAFMIALTIGIILLALFIGLILFSGALA
jgi:hypothetical protein